MFRRESNTENIRKIRAHEETRARERLAEITNHNLKRPQQAPIKRSPLPQSDTLHGDTQRVATPVPSSGPLSDRLRAIDPGRFGGDEQTDEGQATAGLFGLDGKKLADLPCDAAAGIIILGRGHNATVRLDDPFVHRVHAHMRWDADLQVHFIAHGGGENSTYVNRQKVRAPVQLRNGNRIRMGKTEFIYRIH